MTKQRQQAIKIYLEGIKKRAKYPNVSVHLGNLTKKEEAFLQKKYDAEKELLGYWKFDLTI